MRKLAWVVVLGACTANSPSAGNGPPTDQPREHDERFVSLWAVTQPYHALYEQTLYRLHADGQLVTGASQPGDCSGQLSEHCVTGSIANCVPAPGEGPCTAAISCVFGDTWGSIGNSTLVIASTCSDAIARPLTLTFNPDSSMNAGFGANATIVDVAGDANWSHDNWDWAFRKCRAGTDPSTCVP